MRFVAFHKREPRNKPLFCPNSKYLRTWKPSQWVHWQQGCRAPVCQCEGDLIGLNMGRKRKKSPRLQFPSLNTMGVQVWVCVRVKLPVVRISKSATAVLQHCFIMPPDFWHISVMERLLERRHTDTLNLITPPLCTLQIVTPRLFRKHRSQKASVKEFRPYDSAVCIHAYSSSGKCHGGSASVKKALEWYLMGYVAERDFFYKPCSLPFFFFAVALLNLLRLKSCAVKMFLKA